jgi:hypothetical protein
MSSHVTAETRVGVTLCQAPINPGASGNARGRFASRETAGWRLVRMAREVGGSFADQGMQSIGGPGLSVR